MPYPALARFKRFNSCLPQRDDERSDSSVERRIELGGRVCQSVEASHLETISSQRGLPQQSQKHERYVEPVLARERLDAEQLVEHL